jgi:hypothetical protein
MKKKGGESAELYKVLNELCKTGIDKIIQTYSRGDSNVHLLHTLKMYRTMLENPDFFIERSDDKENENENKTINDIDSIFIKIRDIYRPEHYSVILNIFKLLQQNPTDFETYISCLNNLFAPINIGIIKWINENIIF